jgi:hypothetical protein
LKQVVGQSELIPYHAAQTIWKDGKTGSELEEEELGD